MRKYSLLREEEMYCDSQVSKVPKSYIIIRHDVHI